MSISVQFMLNSSPNEKIEKNVTSLYSFECVLKNNCSVQNPVIEIAGNITPSNCNYMYIPVWGRYYYITDISTPVNGIWTITGRIDVLMSFKDSILNSPCTIVRQQNNYSLYLNDPETRLYANPYFITKEFPSGFSNRQRAGATYVMLVAGG